MNQENRVLSALRNRRQVAEYTEREKTEESKFQEDPISNPQSISTAHEKLLAYHDQEEGKQGNASIDVDPNPNQVAEEDQYYYPPPNGEDENVRPALPQEFRQLNEVEPEVQAVQEKNWLEENTKDLWLLIGFSLYVFVSTFAFKSSNMFKIMVPPTASEEERRIHGDGKCNFDSNHQLRLVVIYSFIPTIIIRAIGHVLYNKKDPLDFVKFYNRIEVFWHASYGFWTLLNLYNYMTISQNCRDMLVMSMVNFQLTLIFGCFSAVNVIFVGLVIVILVPFLIYRSY